MSPSRIDELRRRVQNDPASIAFAQLAEEYRRSGHTDEAVRICREGLVRHPGYLSARVTLGRALLDLGEMAEARGEFEFVVAEAPENLAAVRGLAEIFHRDGQTSEALSYYERALALARHDPEIEEIVQQLSRQIGVAASGPPGGLSFEEAHQELLSAAERVPLAAPSPPPPVRDAAEGSTAPFDFDRLVAALGTPVAPPQVEAAVEGRAVPAIELPDPVDLGPNPFAALEAELRGHTEPVEAPRMVEQAGESADMAGEPLMAAHGSPEEGVDSGEAAADVAAAAPLPDAPAAAADGSSEVAADHRVPAADTLAGAAGAAVGVGLPEAAVLEDTMLAGTDGIGESAGVASSQQVAPAAEEDVLGDLESWLDTLHDRSTE